MKLECPNCKSHELIYSWTYSNLITESLSAFKELDLKKIIFLPLIKETFFAVPYVFVKSLVQDVPDNPGLQCKHCRKYLLPCPKCNTIFETKEFPSGLSTYNCPECKAGFTVCERNNEFDRLLKELPGTNE